MKKLTATTPYGVFTRTTAHKYRYVSVGASMNPAWLQSEKARIEKKYGANPPEHIASHLAWLQSGLDVAASVAADNSGYCNGWHHTLAAAQKAVRDSKRIFRGVFPVDNVEVD